MSARTSHPSDAADAFCRLCAAKVVVFDGAMGSMIRTYQLQEADFRGERFKSHGPVLKGNNDLLSLTRPDVLERIHSDYYAAGADVVATNTTRSTSIGLAAYGCESFVREINLAAVACARRAAQSAEAAHSGRRCFVAGAVGSLHGAPSFSIDGSQADDHAVTREQVVAAYTEQIGALLDGGVDALSVETTFDLPGIQAVLFAIEQGFGQRGDAARVPVMLRVVRADTSSRTPADQEIAALYQGLAHARLFSIGISGTLGEVALRTGVEELAHIADCYTTCHLNAGWANTSDNSDQTPEKVAKGLGEFARKGWLNLVGGGRGTTPAHIAAIAQAVKGLAPRQLPQAARALRLSGSKSLAIT